VALRDRDALAKWETDRAYPDVNIIKDLADFFEVTADYLLGRKEDGLAVRIAEALKQNKGLLTKEEEEFLLKTIRSYLETVKSQRKK
jgi:transcriptional regulator with XRE-family HTH domain